MTENKRFKKLVSSIDYYDIWDTVENKGYVAEELINALYDENVQLKQQIERFNFILKESIKNERTDMGRNVLIQLAESLDIEVER